MTKINLKITTPERTIYDQDVDSVSIPTRQGEITVLPEHIPLISLLAPGEMHIRVGKEEEFIAVSGGFIEVGKNSVTILADSADLAQEIDLQKVEEARARAEKLLTEKSTDQEEYAAIVANLEREMAKLKVGKKYRQLKGIRISREDIETKSYQEDIDDKS
jgi:F-type H+-transporting ATPase subunit epsilon